jgi:hypothetical protein
MGLQIEKTLGQLETLNKGNSLWSRVGRTLRISQISPNALKAGRTVTLMQDLLWPTLRSLKNVRTVE